MKNSFCTLCVRRNSRLFFCLGCHSFSKENVLLVMKSQYNQYPIVIDLPPNKHTERAHIAYVWTVEYANFIAYSSSTNHTNHCERAPHAITFQYTHGFIRRLPHLLWQSWCGHDGHEIKWGTCIVARLARIAAQACLI